MLVSVIIVNYNTKQLAIDCINSLFEHTTGVDIEVILVDNNSEDGSTAFFQHWNKVKLISSKTNLGFGNGNNLGVEHANGEFIFLINSDMIFTENAIKKMLDFFLLNEKTLNIGVLGCKLTDIEGNTKNSGGGFPWVKHDLRELYLLIKERITRKTILPRDTYNFNLPFFEIDYDIGANIFLRKSLFDKVSGFDPNTFIYYEESDIQLRIRNLGYHNFVTTGSQIIHFEGGGNSDNKEKKITKNVLPLLGVETTILKNTIEKITNGT